MKKISRLLVALTSLSLSGCGLVPVEVNRQFGNKCEYGCTVDEYKLGIANNSDFTSFELHWRYYHNNNGPILGPVKRWYHGQFDKKQTHDNELNCQ